MSAGDAYTIAVKTDNTLWSWGFSGFGILGIGTVDWSRNTPNQIGSDANWASMSTGKTHAVAVKTDGTLWAWGKNLSGQLGDGTILSKNAPVRIGTGTNWVSARASGNHTVAVNADGTLWGWGDNLYGEVGDGTFGYEKEPVNSVLRFNMKSAAREVYHRGPVNGFNRAE